MFLDTSATDEEWLAAELAENGGRALFVPCDGTAGAVARATALGELGTLLRQRRGRHGHGRWHGRDDRRTGLGQHVRGQHAGRGPPAAGGGDDGAGPLVALRGAVRPAPLPGGGAGWGVAVSTAAMEPRSRGSVRLARSSRACRGRTRTSRRSWSGWRWRTGWGVMTSESSLRELLGIDWHRTGPEVLHGPSEPRHAGQAPPWNRPGLCEAGRWTLRSSGVVAVALKLTTERGDASVTLSIEYPTFLKNHVKNPNLGDSKSCAEFRDLRFGRGPPAFVAHDQAVSNVSNRDHQLVGLAGSAPASHWSGQRRECASHLHQRVVLSAVEWNPHSPLSGCPSKQFIVMSLEFFEYAVWGDQRPLPDQFLEQPPHLGESGLGVPLVRAVNQHVGVEAVDRFAHDSLAMYSASLDTFGSFMSRQSAAARGEMSPRSSASTTIAT